MPKPEQVGTGIFIDHGRGSIILTAAHVVHEFSRDSQFALAGTKGRLFCPEGRLFVSGKRPIKECESFDHLDSGILMLTPSDDERLRENFTPLAIGDIHSSTEFPPGAIGVIVGYPARRSEVIGNGDVISQCLIAETTVSKLQRVPGRAFRPDLHVILDYNRRKGFIDNETQRRSAICRPKGMSGGGIFLQESAEDWKLAGILTDFIERKNVFVGTRVLAIVSALRTDSNGVA